MFFTDTLVSLSCNFWRKSKSMLANLKAIIQQRRLYPGGRVTRILGLRGRAARNLKRRPISQDFWLIFMLIFKDFRVAKPVETPSNQVSFLFKGISMEDKVITNQFSQLRSRESNDENNISKSFCYDSESWAKDNA